MWVVAGKWRDEFLAKAFGPLLDPVMQLCISSDAEHTLSKRHTYAITSSRVQTPLALQHCETDNCLLLEELQLPVFVVDGEDVCQWTTRNFCSK